MNWQDFLDEKGATRDDGGTLLHFGAPPAPGGEDLLAVCEHLAILSVSGADAATFLQGQLTADIRDVADGATHTAMQLSLKGRGLASLRVLPAAHGFDLVLPKTMLEACRKRLQMYVLRSKVELVHDERRVALGLSGPGAVRRLQKAGLPAPDAADRVAFDDTATVARPAGGDRFLVLLQPQMAMEHWSQLAAGATAGGPWHWLLEEIFAGEGHVWPGGEDRFLPQELNYDVTGGVSFHKGCYTGQEVVARMHFKGKLKQRLAHLSWTSGAAAPETGSMLRDENEKAVGEVVTAAPAGDRCHVLAVLRLGHEGTLTLDGEKLDWRREALPYALPEEARADGA